MENSTAQTPAYNSSGDHHHHNVTLSLDLILSRISLSLVGLFTIVGNGMLIVCILRTRRLQTNTNCLILGLAFGDFIVGLVVPILTFVKFKIAEAGELACLALTMCPMVVSIFISLLLQVAIAVEKFVAIIKPLHYARLVIKKRVVACTVIVVVYAIVLGCLPAMGWNNVSQRKADFIWEPQLCMILFITRGSYMAFLISHMLASALITGVLYGIIFYTARHQARKIQPIEPKRADVNSRLVNKHRKGVAVLATMVAYFMFSWTGFAIVYCIEFRWFTRETVYSFRVPRLIEVLSTVLAMANSAVNPYIYGLGNSRMRRALKVLWRCQRSESIEFSLSDTNANGSTSQSHGLRHIPTEVSISRVN